ncbi:tyrosine-protein phosphatase [Lactobacillus sp. CC-MHH1034]|uniref:tyrosine-protein phosphatase n=1 Tax=Agrilactobacillus fermenti TaxID=2586909 RepID=UPI001E29AD52|nr:tyrosine-protein phosphatase [Agrilactobacillus fermenti]MCD2255902.1 tyrosine-protein phosphatase [Agrilactobacillus fermenti]
MTVTLTNFRTLGHYPTIAGGEIKPGLLYRSGQLVDLTAEQTSYLADTLNIKRVVDFRSADERQQQPEQVWQTADYQVIDILADATANNASLGEMLTQEGHVRQGMLETYEQMVVSDSAKRGYHQFLTALVTDVKPTVFHCFAGKDRTGVAAALILKIAGVSDQVIFADYLKTNMARQAANQEIIATYGKDMTPAQKEALGQALLVDQAYLKHYFTVIDQNYGDFDHYLQEALALTPDFVTEFKHTFVK